MNKLFDAAVVWVILREHVIVQDSNFPLDSKNSHKLASLPRTRAPLPGSICVQSKNVVTFILSHSPPRHVTDPWSHPGNWQCIWSAGAGRCSIGTKFNHCSFQILEDILDSAGGGLVGLHEPSLMVTRVRATSFSVDWTGYAAVSVEDILWWCWSWFLMMKWLVAILWPGSVTPGTSINIIISSIGSNSSINKPFLKHLGTRGE